jgi:branched-chain amino acid transport system permease protein
MSELVASLREHPRWTLAGGGVLLALAVLPLFLSGYGIQVMMIGYFFAILGISWNILAGYTGQFSLAQHAFATLGAYASAAAILGLGQPLVVGLLVGTVVAALLGFGIGWLTLGMRGIYFAIATWAFAETVRLLLAQNYQITRGDMGLQVPYLFATPDPFPYYYVFLGVMILTLLLNALMLRLKIGYRMRAIRDDQELAVACGVDVTKWKRIVFLISTAIAGLAGALYGHSIGLLTPSQAHFSQMSFIVIAVVLGGFRTLWGPVIGALLVQGLSEALRSVPAVTLNLFGTEQVFKLVEWRFIIFALLVMLIVRFYPPGIMGFIEAAVKRFESSAAQPSASLPQPVAAERGGLPR